MAWTCIFARATDGRQPDMPVNNACLRCKLQKLRCDKEDGAEACGRCTRAGFACVKAPPSRQGKRTRSPPTVQKDSTLALSTEGVTVLPVLPVLPATNAQGTPQVEAVLASSLSGVPTMQRVRAMMEACCGSNRELLDILTGLFEAVSTPPRTAMLWTMRHFCALATGFSWVSLFQGALKIAAWYGIVLSDVVLDLEREMPAAPPAEDGALDPNMIAYLEHSSRADGTFWVGRRLNPTRTGELVMWASSNFKEQVASEEALRAQWRKAGEGGAGMTALWDAFVHPDDRSFIPIALGRVIATMPSFDPDVIQSNCESSTGLVRMLMGAPLTASEKAGAGERGGAGDKGGAGEKGGAGGLPRSYVLCHIEVHMGCSRGMLWIGVKAAPLAVVLSTPIDGPSLAAAPSKTLAALRNETNGTPTLDDLPGAPARPPDRGAAGAREAGGSDDGTFDDFDPDSFFSTTTPLARACGE